MNLIYNLIYVYSINDINHEGLLKIGKASIDSRNNPPSYFTPSCPELNEAARKRILEQTGTASINFNLIYTELATKKIDFNGEQVIVNFSDKDVHDVLLENGIVQVMPNGTTGNEWFQTSIDVVVNAIWCVKNNSKQLNITSKIADNKTNENYGLFLLNEAMTYSSLENKEKIEMLYKAKQYGIKKATIEIIKCKLSDYNTSATEKINYFTEAENLDDFLELEKQLNKGIIILEVFELLEECLYDSQRDAYLILSNMLDKKAVKYSNIFLPDKEKCLYYKFLSK